jgi:hypothetical protein
MMGRYGVDDFSRATNVVVLICLLISMIGGRISFLGVFYWIGVLLIIYNCYRMLSRNHTKRYAENQKFCAFRYRMTVKWSKRKKEWSQRKYYRFFKCPDCKQKVRVPKGRGKICITCPKCRREFLKRS